MARFQSMVELFREETRWTKFASARTRAGNPCGSRDEAAVQWCLIGALDCVYGATPALRDALFACVEDLGFASVALFNDYPTTDIERVRLVALHVDQVASSECLVKGGAK